MAEPRQNIARDERGGVAVMIAVCGATFIAATAAAVDLGSVHLASRRAQGAADLAAIAAASNISRGAAAAKATARANMKDVRAMDIAFGHYTADPNVKPRDRFQKGAEADAAQVTIETEAPLYFGAAIYGKPSVTVRRTATAAQARLGSFSLGTRLAALRGGVANALLSGLTGSEVSLSVMDYNALVAADVSLFSFLDALRADMKLTGVSYDQLLAQDVKTGDVLKAAAKVLAAAGRLTESRALSEIALATGANKKLKLGKLIDLGPYAPQDKANHPLDVSVSAYDLVSATLQLSNANRQVELDLDHAGVPGLADVKAYLAVGEPPTQAAWFTIGRAGEAQVRTAQARLYVEASVLSAAPSGGMLTLKVPLLVELASAEARLSAVRCGNGGSKGMTVSVRPSVATAYIGDIDEAALTNFRREMNLGQATLVSLPLIKVKARAQAKLGSERWTDLNFSSSDIDDHTIRRASSGGFVGGVAGALMKDIDIDATVAGLSLGPAAILLSRTVGATLSSVAPALDTLIDGLLSTAGVSLGEADVRPAGVRCMSAALVI